MAREGIEGEGDNDDDVDGAVLLEKEEDPCGGVCGGDEPPVLLLPTLLLPLIPLFPRRADDTSTLGRSQAL